MQLSPPELSLRNKNSSLMNACMLSTARDAERRNAQRSTVRVRDTRTTDTTVHNTSTQCCAHSCRFFLESSSSVRLCVPRSGGSSFVAPNVRQDVLEGRFLPVYSGKQRLRSSRLSRARGLDQPRVLVAKWRTSWKIWARVLVQRCSGIGHGYFYYLYCRCRSYRFLWLSSVPSLPLPPLLSALWSRVVVVSAVACLSGKITKKRVRSRKVEKSKALKKEFGVLNREKGQVAAEVVEVASETGNSLAERAGLPDLWVCEHFAGSRLRSELLNDNPFAERIAKIGHL